MDKIIEFIKKNGFQNADVALRNYSSNDYIRYVSLNPDTYHRTRVFSNDDFEIFVITWNKLQQSKIHDHSENGCYMLILEGELVEELYNDDTSSLPIQTTTYKKGNVSYIHNDIGYHRILNKTANIAVSLHIYSPPNHIQNNSNKDKNTIR
jgi:cysteine dioxygenase